MALINYNSDVLTNNLIPTAENAKNHIKTALSSAYKVSYSYGGEITWSRRKGNLTDCREEIEKYINWLNEIKRDFHSNNEELKDDLGKIKVTEIKNRESIVKKM